MVKIGIIIGTTRPNRFSPKPAAWVHTAAKKHKDVEFVLIDLAEVNLPFLDEPLPPAMDQYSEEHTKAWSKIIGGLDGFIIVTGEYNFSIPAVLKNAIDFLTKEWAHKPWAFVSYGASAGGQRAVEHLRNVAGQLKVYSLREAVYINNYWSQLGETGEFLPNEQQENDLQNMLKAVIFWSTEMKASRKRLHAGE